MKIALLHAWWSPCRAVFDYKLKIKGIELNYIDYIFFRVVYDDALQNVWLIYANLW